MERPGVSLMEFPDCLLLDLLKYLDSSSLYQLTKVNKRFEALILDSCLWKKIDARNEPNTRDKIKYCLDRVNKLTSVLCLRGASATVQFLMGVQQNFTEHLTILALENQNIDQPILSLNKFPESLIELSFKNSSISNSSYFFKRTSERMANLKVLILDGCSLINSSVVMSVSKYPSLEILSFHKCQIENSIPYFSIAAWHGFKKLKVLDVRLSGLGNPFLKSMIRCTNIIAFYFQNMDTSYVLDFKNRQYELETKGNKDMLPQVNFTVLGVEGNEDCLVTDKGTAEFKRATSKNESCGLPDSFLYTDPYGPCTCGCYDSIKENRLKDSDFFHDKPLEKHSEVDSDEERSLIREYPVKPAKKQDKIDGAKRKAKSNTSQKQPFKKRRRSSKDKKTSTSDSDDSIGGGNDRIAISGQGSRVPSEPSTSKRKTYPETSGCSISSTETVECCEENDSPASPKRRKLSDDEDESHRKERFIEISWRNDSVQRRHGHIGTGLVQPHSSFEERSEADESERKEGQPTSCHEIDIYRSSLNSADSEEPASSNPAPTTSGAHSEAETSQPSAGTSAQNNGSQPNPPAEPEDVQNRIGVVFRNRTDANNRNVLQICIRGNRDRRSLFVPEVIRMGQGVDFPIVLNAVRMINFMLPPDQQAENAAQNQEIEMVNMQMDKTYHLALRRLSFRGYIRVTDATLKNLEHLNLELIDLTYTKVTKHGIHDFLRMNPNCRVLHKEFCVCRPNMHF